jgi:hypothetical protein
MMSAMVSILFSSLVFGQSSTILKNSGKLREFQSTTTGYVRYVKTLTSNNSHGIAQLTDSYAAKIKSIFDRSPSLTFGCKAIDCINSSQSTNQLGTSVNLLQDDKTKFAQFMMLIEISKRCKSNHRFIQTSIHHWTAHRYLPKMSDFFIC